MGDVKVDSDHSIQVGGRKMPNGEKLRTMMRLRKMIDDMNDLCEEHFVLTVAHPDISKHLSYYGSRPAVRALYNSNVHELLKQSLTEDIKASIYMPVVSTNKDPGEKQQSETQLYSKILKLLEAYNYPAKEHFSYKIRGTKGTAPKPKPNYWPASIKFCSLISGNIQSLLEPSYTQYFESRRTLLLMVLNSVRQHYKTLLTTLNRNQNEVEEVDEDELVDIEDVANYEEHESEAVVQPSDKPPELEMETNNVEDNCAGTSYQREIIVTPDNKNVPLLEGPSTKKRVLPSPAHAVKPIVYPYIRRTVRRIPVITEKDRVFTFDANNWTRKRPYAGSYEIRNPPMVNSGAQSGFIDQPRKNPNVVIFEGQEYDIIDSDDLIETSDVYDEIALPMEEVESYDTAGPSTMNPSYSTSNNDSFIGSTNMCFNETSTPSTAKRVVRTIYVDDTRRPSSGPPPYPKVLTKNMDDSLK